VKVRIIPSAADGSDQHFLTSLLVNDTVVVDAGCIGFHGDPAWQSRIEGVVLTHSHADHVCSLPTLAMNVVEHCDRRTVVWSHHAVHESLREDVFNWRVWPDFLTLVPEGEPIVRLEAIEPRRPFELAGLRFTAVPVNHPVPTVGYIVEDGRSAIVICPDSGPTEELWARAARVPGLSTVFVGTAFPNECDRMAEVSGHLTPNQLASQLRTLGADVSVIAIHIKPAHRAAVIRQLRDVGRPGLLVGTSRSDYAC
jgi:ribonuclease BN (tRNA processing enzyme)